jgi:hypothetical protein
MAAPTAGLSATEWSPSLALGLEFMAEAGWGLPGPAAGVFPLN